MSVLILEEVLRTRYIINSMNDEFRGVLCKARDNGDTIDFARCRFGPNCAATIRSFYGQVQMINSREPDMDKLLKRNAEVALMVEEEYPILPISLDVEFNEFLQGVQSIPQGGKYLLRPNPLSTRHIAYCVLLIMKRPDLDLDLTNCSSAIYDFVHNEWRTNAVLHNDYIEFTHPVIVDRKVDVDGFVHISKYEKLPVSIYVNTHEVLPADFGSKNLLLIDSAGKPTGEWCEVINKCLRTLVSVEPDRRHLEEFLKFRKDD